MRALLITILLTCSVILNAQELKVTYEARGKNLVNVLKELEKAYGIHFAYSVQELRGKKINIKAENQSLESFLSLLLEQQGFTHRVLSEEFISISKPTFKLIRFRLSDPETGEILPFATARIEGTTRVFISDGKGTFQIEFPSDSQDILELSFLGYEKKSIPVSQIKNSSLVSIELVKSSIQLQEVVVKEYLNKGITVDDQAASISIDTQELEILPGLSERDVLLSAQILAGIGSADESAGGLNIRGSPRDNALIYWNNIPVYQSAHYFGNISAFIPSFTGKVEIFKNYIPVTFGGASSGLLLVNSRKPVEQIVESNFNLTHADIYASIPFAEYAGQVSVAARRSYNDVLPTPTFNSLSDKLFRGSLTENAQGISDDFKFNSKLIFHDINLNIDFSPNGKDEFSMSVFHSQSELDYNSRDGINFLQSLQRHDVNSLGSNISWTRRWRNDVSSIFTTSYTDYQMDYSLMNIRNEDDDLDNHDLLARANELENLESRFVLTYVPVKKHVFNMGYQFNRVNTNLLFIEDYFLEGRASESIDSRGNSHGMFADYFGKFDFGLQVGLGVRQNKYSSIDEPSLDRQVRLNYEILPDFMIKSAAGVYHQYISSFKEVDFVFANTLEQNWITANGNDGIPVVRNEQLMIGALLTKAGWVIDIDGYQKKALLPLLWNFGFRSEEEDLVLSGTERIKGIDFTLKKRWKYYRAWFSYTFQDSEIDAFEQRFPSSLNIRHQIQISQTLNHKQFEFSLGYTIKSGLPYTEYLGYEQVSVENEEDGPFFELLYAPTNSSRLPTYHRVDMSGWYKLEAKGAGKFSGEIGLSILNLLDSENFYSRTFSIGEDEEDDLFVYERNRSLIGLTPNLSVRLNF